VHARTPLTSTEDLANRSSKVFAMITKRHEQLPADGQLDVKNADSVRSARSSLRGRLSTDQPDLYV
jgi:hypothetical protein